MTTRRTTRRSLALGGLGLGTGTGGGSHPLLGDENNLQSNNHPSSVPPTLHSHPSYSKAPLIEGGTGGTGSGNSGIKPSAIATLSTRRRSAFTDVTNGSSKRSSTTSSTSTANSSTMNILTSIHEPVATTEKGITSNDTMESSNQATEATITGISISSSVPEATSDQQQNPQPRSSSLRRSRTRNASASATATAAAAQRTSKAAVEVAATDSIGPDTSMESDLTNVTKPSTTTTDSHYTTSNTSSVSVEPSLRRVASGVVVGGRRRCNTTTTRTTTTTTTDIAKDAEPEEEDDETVKAHEEEEDVMMIDTEQHHDPPPSRQQQSRLTTSQGRGRKQAGGTNELALSNLTASKAATSMPPPSVNVAEHMVTNVSGKTATAARRLPLGAKRVNIATSTSTSGTTAAAGAGGKKSSEQGGVNVAKKLARSSTTTVPSTTTATAATKTADGVNSTSASTTAGSRGILSTKSTNLSKMTRSSLTSTSTTQRNKLPIASRRTSTVPVASGATSFKAKADPQFERTLAASGSRSGSGSAASSTTKHTTLSNSATSALQQRGTRRRQQQPGELQERREADAAAEAARIRREMAERAMKKASQELFEARKLESEFMARQRAVVSAMETAAASGETTTREKRVTTRKADQMDQDDDEEEDEYLNEDGVVTHGLAHKKMRTSEPEQYYDVHEDFDDENNEDDDHHGHDPDQEEEDQYQEEVIGMGSRLRSLAEPEVGPAKSQRPAKDEGWEDLDAVDEEDPLMVSTYVVEVYDYLRELELTTMADDDYMLRQNDINWRMRGILIDWLVEIHTKFRLLPETIFLATNIIDRFLSSAVVSLIKFQLVGVVALFIASKYEEVVCPSVSNFLYMTDGGYTDAEILRAERYVLGVIDFNLSYPNPINFLRRISKADNYDIQSRTMSKYLMEISIVDHRFMDVPPSLVAAAGNWLARLILERGEWDVNLIHYSGYSEEELKPTAQLMLSYVIRSSSLAKIHAEYTRDGNCDPVSVEVEHPNFHKKYAAKKFFRASQRIRQWAEVTYGPTESFDRRTGRPITLPAPMPVLP